MADPTVGSTAPALEVHEVVRTYKPSRGVPRGAGPRRALEGLSLTVARGEWVALLGPNGSGKSTLVRILATLDRPNSGRVRAFGADLSGSAAMASYRRSLGVVFQHPGLDKLLTVRENLAAQAALHRVPAPVEAIARVAALLDISDRLDDRVGVLSGGLARRCDLARALLPRPSLLILDEATAGLDLDSRMGFMHLLGSLRREAAGAAMTILMTTHLMDEAELAARVVMMHQGRVVLDGEPAALRGALGGLTIRCPASSEAAERILRDAGLASDVRAGERIARTELGTSELVAVVGASLAGAGVPFEVSPPTLGDAYLVATGSSLIDADVRGHAA